MHTAVVDSCHTRDAELDTIGTERIDEYMSTPGVDNYTSVNNSTGTSPLKPPQTAGNLTYSMHYTNYGDKARRRLIERSRQFTEQPHSANMKSSTMTRPITARSAKKSADQSRNSTGVLCGGAAARLCILKTP